MRKQIFSSTHRPLTIRKGSYSFSLHVVHRLVGRILLLFRCYCRNGLIVMANRSLSSRPHPLWWNALCSEFSGEDPSGETVSAREIRHGCISPAPARSVNAREKYIAKRFSTFAPNHSLKAYFGKIFVIFFFIKQLLGYVISKFILLVNAQTGDR